MAQHPGDTEQATSLRELSALLWRERDLLELLVVQDPDGPEADHLRRSLMSLELHRAITAREAAAELGVDRAAPLQGLIEAAPPEWAAILGGHRRALLQLAVAVDGKSAVDGGAGLQRSLRDYLAGI